MELTLEQYEQLNPRCALEHGTARMTFVTPSVFTRWRVETLHKKEPWTLEWIAGFQPGELLLDCGANVGMYTIWAAATRQARVIAFEPESQNFALLNRNIRENGFAGLVRAYCAALSDTTGFFDLHIADLRLGGSCHAVGEALDYKLEPLRALFAQGCVAYRLDDMVRSGHVPVPDHIKIDVDGFEHKVIRGATETLQQSEVKSLLIETNQNLSEHRAMIAELNALGFLHDPAQVQRAERKNGSFKGVAEYVFRR